MTNSSSISLDEQAIAWLVRTSDPQFDDWEAFEEWLGASPAHADAYHAAAADEAEMVAALAAEPQPLVEPVRRPPRTRRWVGGALAASLLAAIGIATLRPAADQIYETAAGTRRTLALADGSSIALNGGTRIAIEGDDPRAVTVERGEALFVVRNGASDPFTVSVGDATVVDIGTTFDIVRDTRETRVAVAEGAVMWNRNGEAVTLRAGRTLRAVDGSAVMTVSDISPRAIGGWSRGQLVFDEAPLSQVAQELSRTLGVPVSVVPGAEARQVRGVVAIEGRADAVMGRIGPLLGLDVEREGRGWRLAASP